MNRSWGQVFVLGAILSLGAACSGGVEVDGQSVAVGDACQSDDVCSSGVCHEGICVLGIPDDHDHGIAHGDMRHSADMGARDMASPTSDMSQPGQDMSAPPGDMSRPPGDMSTNPADMSSPQPMPPVDCAPLEGSGFDVCESSQAACGVVYEDGTGCEQVCQSAGLACARVFENRDGVCAIDESLPELSCDPASGHQSDYCVCVQPGCEACAQMTGATCYSDGSCVCEPKTCASAGYQCGQGLDDGCGGALDCPGTCGAGEVCRAGFCEQPTTQCLPGDCPAFPGAEGYGATSTGGRGGSVCIVTNTNNSGSGSLRDCAESGSGALTIVFEVGGIISLNSPLTIRRDKLTIAGQTAPGDGIVVKNYQVDIKGDDIIVQHIRFRAGDDKKKRSTNGSGFTEDSLTLSGKDIIVDHVSASWGIDENLSAGTDWDNMTIQYSIISEGLYHTKLFHGEYDPNHHGHSMGGLYKPKMGDSEISIHHNLFAHNNNRNPAIGTYESGQRQTADIRNNVIYNCRTMGYSSGDGGRIDVNYVGNYGVFGPDSNTRDMFRGNDKQDVNVYQNDNFLDTSRNGQFDGSNVGWNAIDDGYDRENSPFNTPAVTTQSAPAALQLVLANAGARPWNRDEVDARVVSEVQANNGKRIDSQSEVGGWGNVASGSRVVDSDRDGMPDSYEVANGHDKNSRDHNGDRNGDGYTNLENYLHWAARNRP